MTTESIDIVLTDKVPDTIRAKILNIATAALEAYNNVDKLQKALAQAASNSAFIQSTSQAALATQQLALASINAQTAQIKQTTAATNLAIAQQRLEAATQKAAQAAASNVPSLSALSLGLDKTAAANTNLATATAGTTRELLVLGHELITGRDKQFLASLVVLTERTGSWTNSLKLLASLFSPLNIALATTIGFTILLVKAFIDAESQSRAFSNAITLSGNAAGLTLESFKRMADGIADANNVTKSSVRDVVSELVASGRFTNTEVAQFADSAVKLSKLTGDSTEKIIKEFIRAADAPGHYATELEKSTNLIAPALASHIRELDRLGEQSEATRLLSETLFNSLATQGPAALSGFAADWQALKKVISDTNIELGDFATNAGRLGLLSAIGIGVKNIANGGKEAASAISGLNAEIVSLRENNIALATDRASGTKEFQAQIAANNELIAADTKRLLVLDNARASVEAGAAATASATKANHDLSEALRRGQFEYDRTRGSAEKLREELGAFKKVTDELKSASAQGKDIGAEGQNILASESAIIAAITRRNQARKVAESPQQKSDDIIAKANDELLKQISYYDQLSERRTALQKLDEIDIRLRDRTPRLPPQTQEQRASYLALAEATQHQIAVSKELDKIVSDGTANYRAYGIALEAIKIALDKGYLTTAQATKEYNKQTEALLNLQDPLRQYGINITLENQALNFNVNEREAATKALQFENAERAKGLAASPSQLRYIIETTQALNLRKQVVSELDKLEQESSGTRRQLIVQEAALTIARDKGIVSQDRYERGLVQIRLATANLNISSGIGKFEDSLISSLGRVVQGFKGATAEMTDAFGTFFTSMEDGFANSIGKAIVEGKSLSDSLRDIATQGVEALISSLVKVGIQYVINAAIGNTALTAATSAQVAAATAVALAWAPAEAAVSLASYGANAIPAEAGIIATHELSAALALIKGFQVGGYTGDAAQGQIAGVVHGQEFVTNAAATARNRDALEAMNRGATVGNGGVNIVVENHGTPQKYVQAPSLTAGQVRLIARDEVNNGAPTAVASDLRNPNSSTSKALVQTHDVTRKR